MAINVDTVYKTVLLILNKEQRGYITPDEFNKIATQVQLEIFESYFDELNQQLRVPDNDSEYADRVKNIDEQLSLFKAIKACNYMSGNEFAVPISSTPPLFTNPIINTSLGVSVYSLALTSTQLAAGTVQVFFNGILQPQNAYVIAGTNIILATAPGATSFQISVTVSNEDFYRLGTVIYNDDTEVQRVQRNDLLYINSSPLTKPTKTYPLYIYEVDKLYLYPTTISSGISASFVRKPKNVIWNFTSTAPSYTYTYNPATSQNFELSVTEQTNVILKILMYSGVVIQNPQIVQVAAQQIQTEQVNSKS
jgi:hypothetical protein